MEMDPNPPSFNIPYSVPPMNLGENFAQGMAAGQKAGESLGQGISAAFDVMTRNQNANDTLTAMNQSGMLSHEAYQAVAGKSLGAKETMLGMYAGQWLAQQAQSRELQKIGYTGQTDVDVAHAKLLDTISAVKSGYGAAVGVEPGKLPVQPNQGQAGQPQVRRAFAPGQAPRASLVAAPVSPAVYGTAATPTNPTYNQPSKLTIGAPIGSKEQVPPGARVGTLRGQNGIMMPDGVTFRPFSS